jgi:2-polyprenyl-3-methyl-5-hydroxy-6-metoxy-1,4-benzoquinol methylase
VFLTISTTARPATDLGFLLHKHPGRAQAFGVAAGTAHVFYPQAGDGVCTAALLLDLDPTRTGEGHVDDRPYAAGSLLAVALGTVFRTAMASRCTARPELPERALPLTVRIPTLACRTGVGLVERLFAPLGWAVDARPIPLDPAFPEWGDSRYLDTTLTATLRLADALTHLYVLLPALDGSKHYRVGADEVDKLLRAGETWLAGHPERTLITERYLVHRRAHVRTALERLAESDDVEEFPDALEQARVAARADSPGAVSDAGVASGEPGVAAIQRGTCGVVPADPTAAPQRPQPLAVARRAAVVAALNDAGARRVLDLGCGGGALLRDLLADASFTVIVGADVSAGALDAAERRLRRLPERAQARVTLRQSALTYADPALAGYDAAVLMEVIEHVDPERLPALENAVFGVARPGTVVVTTPNAEYNPLYPGLTGMRHADHRFEWTRAEFAAWCDGVASRRGYTVVRHPVGPGDPAAGAPTQMAVFSR